MAPHHKLIGRWIAETTPSCRQFTRREARTFIERTFGKAVLDILKPIEMADLRVAVLDAQDERPPAMALMCDSIGQIDLGWIETSEAPTAWRAAAYKALARTLGIVLPIISFHDLFEEISMYYWEGETDDEAARQYQIEMQGVDPEEVDEDLLPSAVNGRRPDWMLEANAGAPRTLPPGLRNALRKLRAAHRAVRRIGHENNAWHFDMQEIYEYIPGIEDCSTLPPLTLVPFEQFARELDDICRHGMEYGFVDVAGLCPLPGPGTVDAWFASLRVGAQLVLAAQELVQLDPEKL